MIRSTPVAVTANTMTIFIRMEQHLRSCHTRRQVASYDMYVFMQSDAATCRMNSNQFEFMRHVAATKCRMHILSPRVTCTCDKSVNKPIAGLSCDRRPWEKGLGTCPCDKSPCVTGPLCLKLW